MALGFFTGDNSPDSYEAAIRKRRLADALLLQSQNGEPIRSWTQGGAKLVQALSGTIQNNRLDASEKANNEAFGRSLASILGGPIPSPVAPSQSMTTADAGGKPSGGANMPGDMTTWANAIKKKESAGSGDYAAVGPTHPKLGRALGAYQVMEANIGPWSREALGREVTPDEFMKNPQIQDQIFQHKFGQYVQKYGNPQDAASAWFTGRPMAQGANARDVLGTTGAGYVADFNRNIGQPTPVQTAQAPVASDAPPMAYAASPAGAAISGAAPMPPPRPQGQQVAQAIAPTSPPIPQPQPTGNVNAALYAIMSDPRFSPQQKNQAMMLFQMQQKEAPEFTKIGEDEFKRPIMGWVDKRTQRITPAGPMPGMGAQGQGGASDIPPAPPGTDPVKWREDWTKKKFEDQSGPKSEDVTSLRKEVQQLPSYKNAAQAAPIYQAMTRAADTDSKAADLDLVYGLAKIFDPTSVVREGEMVMVNSTASLPSQLMGLINSVNGGARLTPETRAAVMNQAHNRMQAYNDQFMIDSEHYKGIAERRKMDVRDILPSFGNFQQWKPKAGASAAPNPAAKTIIDATPDEIQAELKRRGLVP